jgi:choline kinase
MITIILAAGNNKRFRGKHKALLTALDGRTVIENIVDNLNADPVLVIAQKKHKRKLHKVVQELSLLGKYRMVYHAWLSKSTSGPLDTLWQAREWIHRLLDSHNNGDCSIVISYCDVLLERKCFSEFLGVCKGVEAGIVIFKSDDERFDDAPVTGYKNSGIYYFESGKKMLYTLQKATRGNGEGVPNIVYGIEGDDIMFDCNEVIDIGTPKDYEEYIND